MNRLSRRSVLSAALSLPLTGLVLTRQVRAADQPRMQAALQALKTARQELQAATADKGGHRVKALKLVNDAIIQVEKGIEFDRKN